MVNYQKMYAILCGAVDAVIDPLEKLPSARPQAQLLRQALLEAEELYIQGAQPPPPPAGEISCKKAPRRGAFSVSCGVSRFWDK